MWQGFLSFRVFVYETTSITSVTAHDHYATLKQAFLQAMMHFAAMEL